jgi:two-component system OmpR family sensor kinase
VAALALQAQLAERAGDPRARDLAFAELQQAIDRARRMVRQLLQLARLEPGEVPEPLTGVDVASLAREVVGSYAAQAEAQGVDLGADAPLAATVPGAREALRSLVENLVDNALRYAPRGTEVTVAARSLADGVELTVVDEGPGIAPAARERVFERFHRIAGDATPGSGLGLAIAKAVVDHHRGTIELGSAHAGDAAPGLLVRVWLPAEVAAAPENQPSQRSAARSADGDAPTGRGKRLTAMPIRALRRRRSSSP